MCSLSPSYISRQLSTLHGLLLLLPSDAEQDVINFLVFHFYECLKLLTSLLVESYSTVLIYVHHMRWSVSAHLEYR